MGDLQLPPGEGKHPAIIMLHGSGESDRTDWGKYMPIMERFLRAGYAIFSWDKPDIGDSTGKLSNNADVLAQRAGILIAAIELLKQHPLIDPDRIGTWGISQAGYVIPLTLTMTDDIAFMIVISGPAMDSYDQGAFLTGQVAFCKGASHQEARQIEQWTRSAQKAATYEEYRDNIEALRDNEILMWSRFRPEIMPEDEWQPEDQSTLAFFNPIDAVELTTIPVLAVFGELDRQVDPFQGATAYEKVLEKSANPHSRVELYPGVDHNIVLAKTGCLSERDARPRNDWTKYPSGYLDLMEDWLVGLSVVPPQPSGTGSGLIAFFSARDGNDEIYLMDADGNNQRNLTNHPASDTDPAWSPDGLSMAFSSDRNGNLEIYVMDVSDGLDPDVACIRRLTNNPAIDAGPVWSPDGRRIAFISLRDGTTEIYLIDADGGGLRRLTRNSYYDWEIDWSPDGALIAVSSEIGAYSDIYTIDVEGALQGQSNRQQLTDTDGHDAFPQWSPDGSRIAFITNRHGDENWEVYVMDADGSNQQRVTRARGLDGIPTWSPDGTQIAFESDRDGDNEIYVVNVAEVLQDPVNAEVLQLTANRANDQQPVWRPAGKTLAPLLAQLADLPIDEFLNESFRQLQLRYPDTLIAGGLAEEYGVEGNNSFTNLSHVYIRETQQLESAILDLLRSYDRSALTEEQQLSYDIYEWYLADLSTRQAFMYHNYPINGVGHWDTFIWLTTFLADALPLASLEDAEDYVERLSHLDTWAAQFMEGLTRREQAGVIPPRFLLQRSISLMEPYLQVSGDGLTDVETHPLYISFRDGLDAFGDIGAGQKQALLDAALTEIAETVIPSFLKLRDYVMHLETVAGDLPGVASLPEGEAYYEYALRHWSGTGLSPDQVHELGLSEVVRLQAEMRAAAAEMGYSADMSMAELDALFPLDGSWLQGNALRDEYERMISEADSAMHDFFDLRPNAGVILEYNPDAPPAYYEAPPKDGTGPGRMVANLSGSAQFIFYNPVVLTHHESIPGHHTQIALAQELDLPTNFRRDLIFNVYRQHLPFQAYTEGWALYAEGLAAEMGLYEGDPLNNLGRLRLRLHRTARLVVDTGIHAKGWTMQQAIDYFEKATGAVYGPNRLAQISAVPGQACAYSIGMLTIERLRQEAKEQLGDEFDIKEFHNEILGHGPMPMEILERVIDGWIDDKLDG